MLQIAAFLQQLLNDGKCSLYFPLFTLRSDARKETAAKSRSKTISSESFGIAEPKDVIMMEEEGAPEYKIQRLNLLAFPRDCNPVCELTGGKAAVELVTQYLTL